MNSNTPGGRRPQNRRRPEGARARPVRRLNNEPMEGQTDSIGGVSSPMNPALRRSAKKGASVQHKTPAWKVLVTVVIIILSFALVVCTLACTLAPTETDKLIEDFSENPGKALIQFFASVFFKADADPQSEWSDDGAPVIDDADRKSDGVYNFLVVGLNADLGNNTDTIMLVQYDVGEAAVNVVQIPRDTYIDAGYNFNKINSVFAAAYNSDTGKTAERRVTGMEGDSDKGITGFCEFIEKSYAVKIDYYALIDLDAFEGFIDSIGGLKVNVPCRMYYNDPEQDLRIDLYPGEQTLTGYEAMCMVRNRKNYVDQDYGRMNVQKIVLAALLKQIKEEFTVDTLSSVIELAFNDVTTNLSLSNCIYFGTQALDIDMENLNMITMPTTQTSSGYIVTLEKSCIEVINKYLNVYDRDITADDFDKDLRLTTSSISDIHQTYLNYTIDYEVYDGETVDENSIDINSTLD